MKAKQVLYVALIWMIGQWAMAGSQGYRSLRDVDFDNFTYHYGDQEYRVKKGNYEGPSNGTGTVESLEVVDVKFGHLTQTAQEDAVVWIRYYGGGSGAFDALQVFKLENGKAALTDTLEGGDRALGGIKDFYLGPGNGSLYMVSYDNEMNACRACYDYEHITEHKFQGGRLTMVRKSETQPVSESDVAIQDSADEEGGEEELPQALIAALHKLGVK